MSALNMKIKTTATTITIINTFPVWPASNCPFFPLEIFLKSIYATLRVEKIFPIQSANPDNLPEIRRYAKPTIAKSPNPIKRYPKIPMSPLLPLIKNKTNSNKS